MSPLNTPVRLGMLARSLFSLVLGTAILQFDQTIKAQSSWAAASSANWNNASSWSPAAVPGTGAATTIAIAGTYTVTYDSPMAAASIASLTLGSSTVTLTLSAAGFNVAGTTTFVDSSLETINLNSGGVMTNGTLAMTSQSSIMNLNSGSILTNATTQVANNSSTDGSTRLVINSGAVANLGAVTIGRHVNNNTYGLNMKGGTVFAQSIDVGSRNSYASMTVAGGTLTNAGNLRLGTGTPTAGRAMNYLQTGGTVNCAGTLDMSVAANATTWVSVAGSGSTFSAGGIRLFPNAVSGAVARFTNSGNIYLGSGGFNVLNSGTYTVALNDQCVLGANADWAANVTAVTPASGTVTFNCADANNVAHNIIWTNSISGGASLAKTGGGTLTFLSANTYAGSTTVSAGSLVLGNATALPKATVLTIGGSGTAGIVDLAGFSPQVSGLATAGTASSQFITNSSVANTSTLIFSNSAASSTFAGIIAGGSQPIALTLLGGNLTLSAQNIYAGNIFISSGKLALSGSGSTFTGSAIVLSNSAAILDLTGMGNLTLGAGQSMAGYGAITGNLTAANCPITPGANGAGGTLSVSGGLTLNGNVTNQFDLVFDPSSTANDAINVGGALNVSGVNIIKLNAVGGSLSQNTYHLITAGSVGSGTTNNFQIVGSPGAGLQAAIAVTATGVDLIIYQSGGLERVWIGDGAGNAWDYTSPNWLNAGLPDVFADGSFVIFDDSSTNFTVNLNEAVLPTTVTVAATNNYTLVGSGKISGSAILVKTNSGTLTILTINDYNNLTLIQQGTVQVGNGVVSGTLGSGSLVNNGSLILQQPNSASLGNAISGNGSLVQSGTATLTLNSSNTFSGGLTISSGTVQIGNGGTPGVGNVTNNSAFVFNSSGNNTLNGTLSGSGTLSLLGSGTVTLNAANTYSGTTIVSSGTLLVNGTNSGTASVTVSGTGKIGGTGKIAGPVTVNSGATLAPGVAAGTLTVANNLTVNPGAILNFDLGSSSDKVIVGGNLSLGGTLNIANSGGLVNGTYTLFTYTGSLNLNNLNLGTQPAGMFCGVDTNTPGKVNLIVGIPAFPGALGFGSIATGGRGGSVYHVTTLADSGTGSFRDAVSASGRIIVFDVSGYISLLTAVSAKGNLTIAGQTAPGGGIGFEGGEISFAGQGNVIMRHIRIRPGSDTTSWEDDALSLYQSKNVILDHCSFEFAPYNNIDGVGDSTHVITNITFQNCIIADPSISAQDSSSKGQQFGCHSESIGGTWSWFYNIFANSHNRNPLAKVNTVFINNLEYNNSAGYTTHTSTPFKHDIVNNYFIYGPASGGNFPWYQIDNNQSMYFTGNLRDSSLDGTLNGSTSAPLPGYQGGGTILASPWSTWVTNVPVYTPLTAYRLTVSRAGTLPRDEMDNLIVSQIKTLGSGTTGTGAGTRGPDGGLYTSQTQTGLGNNGYGTIAGGAAPLDSDGDGMPDYWETAVGLNPNNASDANSITLSGYTQLEVYLNWLAEPHAIAAINTGLDIDWQPYADGFTNVSPVYSISNVLNGTVSLLPDGHTAHYTPPADFTGRASFFFKVAGNDGTFMTNTMGLVVTSSALPQNLTWRGDGIANVWDVSTTTNWLNGATPAIFRNADSVTFDDSGSNAPAINLAVSVAPSSIQVNAAQNYSFSGAGALAGAGTLTKAGAGTLTIGTTNSSFVGNVFVNGGTLAMTPGSSLGNASVNLNNATIFSLLAGSPSPFFGGSVTVLAGQSGTLSSGQLANGFSGPVASEDATSTLNFSGGVSFSGITTAQFDGFTGTINIPSGSTLRFSSNSGGNNYGSLNPTFVINGTMQPRNAGNTILLGQVSGSGTLGGPQSNAGTGDTLYVIGGNNLNANFGGSISSNTAVAGATVSVNKTGSGTLTLGGLNTHTGTTTVSAGTLIVNGTNSTSPAVIASGATLGGNGLIGGLVTVNSGGNLAPGNGAGTLNLAGGLTLNSASLNFDLANVTTLGSGVNDLISMSGGTLTLGGTSVVYPNLLNGPVAIGNYTLISGGSATTGSAANLAWGGPTGTRQNFTFNLATPGTVLLQVGGTPAASLIWQGTNGNNWDLVTTNWSNATIADRYYNQDIVQFDDTSANGNVTIAATLQPASIIVSNLTRAYAFSGNGISGATALQKLGAATLTLSGSNSFTGGTLIQGGTVSFANDLANQSGLGSGPITLVGGTLNMFSSSTTTNTSTWGLNVPVSSTGNLNADPACNLAGSLTGGGTLNLFLPARSTTLSGDWSAFTGTVNAFTGTNGDFRIANLNGLAGTTLNLSNHVAAYVTVDPGVDTVIDIGALSGTTSAILGGLTTNSAGADFAWRIGALNTDATFAGTIVDQDTNTATAIQKIGTGAWTLSGNNTYSGDTTVAAGTLIVNSLSGTGTGTGALEILSGATLAGNGIIGNDTTLDDGATLAPGNGPGVLTFTGALTMNDLSVLRFELGTSSDRVVVGGNLLLTGQLNVTNLAGFGPGTYPLFTYTGGLTFGNLVLASAPAGYNYSFDTSTPGVVKLNVTPVTPPNFSNISVSSGKVIVSGSNGIPLANYYVLAATNLTTPLPNWVRIATNQYDANGGFSFTNAISSGVLESFYRLQQ